MQFYNDFIGKNEQRLLDRIDKFIEIKSLIYSRCSNERNSKQTLQISYKNEVIYILLKFG